MARSADLRQCCVRNWLILADDDCCMISFLHASSVLRRQGRQPNREAVAIWPAPVGRSPKHVAPCASYRLTLYECFAGFAGAYQRGLNLCYSAPFGVTTGPAAMPNRTGSRIENSGPVVIVGILITNEGLTGRRIRSLGGGNSPQKAPSRVLVQPTNFNCAGGP